jgi:hypothetical protein
MWLAEPQDGHQGFVDAPLLYRAYPADEFTEPPGVDCAHLLNQDAGGLPEKVNIGAERCRLGTPIPRVTATDRGGPRCGTYVARATRRLVCCRG